MRRSARWIALALACVAACRATVVEPTLAPARTEHEANEPLSRERCIALAIESVPNAAAWEARRLAARARLDRASAFPSPTLSLAWEDFGLNDAAAGAAVETTMSLAVALGDMFARKRREAAAHHELDAEEADIRAEIARLAAEVSRAYDELVASRQRVELERELAAVAAKQRADIERFVATGAMPHIDFERSEAEQAQSLADLARAEAEARARELEFAFALDFERPTALALADPLTSASEVSSLDLAELLARAASARPELAAASARYAAELERAKLTAERVQFLPTIGGGPRVQDDELRGVASIEVVLPSPGSVGAAEREQNAALLAAAAALRAEARDVARDVCAARERLSSAEAYLSEHARDLADRRRALRERTERLFAAGEVEYSELALARRDEVEVRIALLDAELTAAAARVELDRASGALQVPAENP